MSSTRRSLAFAFLDRYASLAIGIGSSMVLARLLTPGEVGMYSVAMALLALLSTVRDMGAGQYLVREKDLTQDGIRAVWAVQLGIGLSLALIVALGSAPAATFYREPQVRDILLLLALNYAINPFGSITYAWLIREMRYDSIALMRLTSSVTTAAVSIVLAWRGHGAMSLAWGNLCGTAANALVATHYRPSSHPWMPGLRRVSDVLSFGGQLTFVSILRTVAAGAPEFIIARAQGLAAAGFLSRANGLVAMFDRLINDAVGNVALAMFSRESREGKDSSASFVRAFSYVTALAWPFAVFLALLADPVVRVLYGGQWDASVPLVRWLAAGMSCLAIIPLCNAALIGRGAMRALIFRSLWGTCAVLVAAACGAAYGMQALGAGLFVASATYAAASLHGVQRSLGIDSRTLLRSSCTSVALAIAVGIGPCLVVLQLGFKPPQPVVALALACVGAAPGMLLALRWTRHPLGAELARVAPWLRRYLVTSH